MQQMTPTKIFRKTAAATEIAMIAGSILFVGIVGYYIYSFF